MNVKLSKDHVHYSDLRGVDRVSVLESWMVSAMVAIVEGEYIYLGVRRTFWILSDSGPLACAPVGYHSSPSSVNID